MSFTICFTPLFTIAAPVLAVWFVHRRFYFWRRARLTWLTLTLWGMSLIPVCQVVSAIMIMALKAPQTAVSHIPFSAEINQAATMHGLDPALLAALVKIESGFNPTAVSPSGAMGLTQIMPETARELGLNTPFSPVENLNAGARYLAWLITFFNGDTEQALMAYHGGPGRIASGAARPIDYQYMQNVMTAHQQYQIVALIPANARITEIHPNPGPFKGVDYSTGCGSPILSPVSGTVTAVGFDGYIGQYGSNNSYLIINDGQREVILMHGKYTAVVGQSIAKDQLVGYEASIGNSTGCHTDISIQKIKE